MDALHIILGTIWSDEASSAFSNIVMVSSCQVEVIGTVKSHTKLVNLTMQGSSVGAQLIQGLQDNLHVEIAVFLILLWLADLIHPCILYNIHADA